MYKHTKNVNTYYFGEIGVQVDNNGTIAECRERGFALLERQRDFLENQVFLGSYDEEWSLRKVLRRFIWHDRIHAKAMYRMALKTFGTGAVPNIFSLSLIHIYHRRGEEGTQKVGQNRGGLRQQAAHGQDVQDTDDHRAHQQADRRTQNVDKRHSRQHVHRHQIHNAADQHVDDRPTGVEMCIRDRYMAAASSLRTVSAT